MLLELLRNANGDEMSATDRSICTKELRRLQEAEWIAAKGVQPPKPVERHRIHRPGTEGLEPTLVGNSLISQPRASETSLQEMS